MTSQKLRFDEIGYWSQIKLDIVREYATAYSIIFHSEKQRYMQHSYIDAFAGSGMHKLKSTGNWVLGSPLNALLVKPPFKEFHFIDLDGDKAASLRDLTKGNSPAHVYEGDCNQILLEQVFPKVQYEAFKRGLCLLDPYGMQLNWGVIEKAGRMKSIDLFLNFPIMDMNRNVLWNHPELAEPEDINRMNAFWGDESWRQAAYTSHQTLFDWKDTEKNTNEDLAEAFRKRLHDKAGFKCVPSPLPMRNSKGATVYYLFFASQKPAGQNIVESIFKKYTSYKNEKTKG